MKKLFLFFLLISASGLAQTINNYKYVILPREFEFMNTENQFRLNTISKFYLEEMGFKAFYDSEQITEGINKDRCNFLYMNVESQKGLLVTKLSVTFKDCQNKLIYKSEAGSSRLKEFEPAYQQALKNAFATISYSYEGGLEPAQTVKPVAAVVETNTPAAVPSGDIKPDAKLKAEAISSGYLLIDETSSTIALRLTKTSDPKTFIALRKTTQGVLIQKGNEWYFEYYQGDTMVSEKINVTF